MFLFSSVLWFNSQHLLSRECQLSWNSALDNHRKISLFLCSCLNKKKTPIFMHFEASLFPIFKNLVDSLYSKSFPCNQPHWAKLQVQGQYIQDWYWHWWNHNSYLIIHINRHIEWYFFFSVFLLKLKNSEFLRKPKIKACNCFIHIAVIKHNKTLLT